jgi:hypothetical protein
MLKMNERIADGRIAELDAKFAKIKPKLTIKDVEALQKYGEDWVSDLEMYMIVKIATKGEVVRK